MSVSTRVVSTRASWTRGSDWRREGRQHELLGVTGAGMSTSVGEEETLHEAIRNRLWRRTRRRIRSRLLSSWFESMGQLCWDSPCIDSSRRWGSSSKALIHANDSLSVRFHLSHQV
jgi:hypothetical protein